MCATCGCDNDVKVSIHRIENLGPLDPEKIVFKPIQNTEKTAAKNERKEITLEQDILHKNNLLAVLDKIRCKYFAKLHYHKSSHLSLIL